MIIIFKTMLIGHLLGDFYFQSSKLAKNKIESNISVTKHAFLYSIALLLVSWLIFSKTNYFYLSIVCLSHFIIDFCKIRIHKLNIVSDIWLYFIDQLIHIVILFIYSYLLSSLDIINFNHWINRIENNNILTIETLISWILLLLVIIQPASLTIKILLNNFQPQETTSNDVKQGIPNVGAFIGMLERILILLMLTINEYSSIGLVITAKSVVRYKKISEDPVFSEYYLLGTLLSTIIVIIAFLMIIP